MPKNLSEKFQGKFPSITPGYAMVKILCLDHALLRILELKASVVEGQQLQQKGKNRRKRKKNEKH